MKAENLPPSLKAMFEKGKSTFNHEGGRWTVALENVADNPWKKSIPADALIIANNGCGDYLYIRKDKPKNTSYLPTVHVFWHEEQTSEVISKNINDLLNPGPAVPSDSPQIYYHGGDHGVRLGDEVSARDFFIRKTGRVVYIPGISKKNWNMEHDGLRWVGIQFQKGTFSGAFVDPESNELKKSVQFIRRCSEPFEELGPDDNLE